MSIGLLGFGRLGRLFVRYFSRDCDIRVFDVKPQSKEIRALGAKPATLKEACAQDIVVLCVPIAAFEKTVARVAPLLRESALVIDVCSVKEHPVRVMKKLLPKSVEILATHPNFGPDSAAESLRGHKLAVCKVRVGAKRYGKVRRALRKKGLALVEMSPAEHDRKMASSLVLTHFIGRTLNGFGAKTTGIDTEGYRRLLRILQTVQNDSWQLFLDMNHFNAYAGPMRRKFLKVMRGIDRRVS